MPPMVQDSALTGSSTRWPSVTTPLSSALIFASLAIQLGLAVVILSTFHVMSSPFERLLPFVVAGFAVHYWLPRRLQLPFFAVLSIGSTVFVLGLQSAGWAPGIALQRSGSLLLIGCCLIGICAAPFSFRLRVLLLVTAGLALAFARHVLLGGRVLAGMWPALGSMFMFRLVLYAYELRYEQEKPPVWRSVAYFFMLPNACFPLYPVVDWKSFSRDYFNDAPLRIYQTGLRWMVRGLLQSVAYQIVLSHFYVEAALITSGGQLAQHLFSTYGLYLRVSGQFHVAVGLLHLFGWNLGETNHHYFLADSFTDYWRRVNIYWKDFMLKVFYNPIAYRMRGTSAARAVLLGSVGAFVATWLLHGYQAFWLTGTFRVSLQDTLFWAILGALVVINAKWELTRGRTRQLTRTFDTRQSFRLALRTMGVFATLCLLWSLWSATSLSHWIGLWKHADAAFFAWIVAGLLVVGACKIGVDMASGLRKGGPFGAIPRDQSQTRTWVTGLIACVLPLGLLWLAQGTVMTLTQPKGSSNLATGSEWSSPTEPVTTGRGYYEDLIEIAHRASHVDQNLPKP